MITEKDFWVDTNVPPEDVDIRLDDIIRQIDYLLPSTKLTLDNEIIEVEEE
jgi:hypothetical protein